MKPLRRYEAFHVKTAGRGEMLELLKEKSIPVKGIDGDAESVAICKSKGLQAQPDGAHDVLASNALRCVQVGSPLSKSLLS